MTAIARIEGYASIFNVSDLNGDIVAPGAFAKALGKRGADGVRMLYQHAVAAPLGRWTRLREDARGLYAVGELILETARARDIAALIEGRALDGLSIGFQTVKARKEREGRVILEADLWEISIVTFPMAEGARIRSLTYPAASDEGEFAATLRQAADVFSGEARSRLPREAETVFGFGRGCGVGDAPLPEPKVRDPLPKFACEFRPPLKGEVERCNRLATKTKPSVN